MINAPNTTPFMIFSVTYIFGKWLKLVVLEA